MKTRTGYVSNSSSSSFLVMCNDDGVFDFLKRSYGYEMFIRDLRKGINDKQGIIGFLADEYCGILDEYDWHIRNNGNRFSGNDVNPLLGFAGICRRIHNENPRVDEIIDEGALLMAEAVKVDGYADGKRMEELSRKFAELLYEEVMRHWSVIGMLEYSGNDGDFWHSMENDFMRGGLVGGESEAFDDFAVIIKNRH